MLWPMDGFQVDAVENHGKRGRVENDFFSFGRGTRQAKSATLKPLIMKYEAATIPIKYF